MVESVFNGKPLDKLEIDILLVTVTKVEVEAVLNLVEEKFGIQPQTKSTDKGTYYALGQIGEATTWMVRSEMGSSGPGGSTLTISDAISDLNPSAIIMVGIAFGVDETKQHIGDVLVSTHLLSYELQRIGSNDKGKQSVTDRGDRSSVSPQLLSRFRVGESNWVNANVRFGLILSGDKLVDHNDFREQLKELAPEAIGGEMEGAGLYAAAKRHKVDWILVKAICDWADGKKHENKKERQTIAARNAAEFVFHVITQGGFARRIRFKDFDQHPLIPSLPGYYQSRDEDIDRLKGLILGQGNRPVGIQGMAGVGKTLLAVALIHDPDIQDAFSDGIYWLTLGHELQLFNRQMELARQLGNENPILTDISDATAYLRRLLRGKKCLLVLDDLWQTGEAEPINVIDTSRGSRLLVTTRDRSVLTGLYAHKLSIDVLSEAQSLTLISQVIGLDSVSDLPQEAAEVVRRCDNLPLALAMCAANIADGYLWHDLLVALEEARLDYLDHNQGSIMATFQISVNRLSQIEAELYQTFAIFPGDIPLPEDMLVTFWTHYQEIEPFEVRGAITRLANRALLTTSGKAAKRWVILHDLLHLFLRQKTRDVSRLHQQWLAAYRKRCQQTTNGVAWESGPNDGYFFQNLAYHLVHADHVTDAMTIVEPGFRTAKLKLFGSDFSFVRDLKLIIESLEANQSPTLIPAIVRCSLVQSLITGIAHSVHPEVLAALVRFNRVERATHFADLTPEGQEKIEQLLAIARTLKEIGGDINLFRETLQKALTYTRLLTRTQVTEGKQDEFRQEAALLVVDLDWGWFEEILAEIAHEFYQVQTRILAARIIAQDHKPANKLLEEVLPALIEMDVHHAELSKTLAHIAQHHLESVQDFIDQFPDQPARDRIRWSAIETLLNIEASSALEVAQRIIDPSTQAEAMVEIASQWAEKNKPAEALDLISGIPSAQRSNMILYSFVCGLPPQSAEYGLILAGQVADAPIKTLLLARTAFLYAKKQNLAKVQELLVDIHQLATNMQPDKTTDFFASIELGKVVAEVALFDVTAAENMIRNLGTLRLTSDLAGQVSASLRDKNLGLALHFAEIISKPDWQALTFADVLFRLPDDDPRVPSLRKKLVSLAYTLGTSYREDSSLRTYYWGVTKGKADPENLLDIWSLEIEDLKQIPPQRTFRARDSHFLLSNEREREEILIDMTLSVARKDMDRAFILLAHLPSIEQIKGFAQLVKVLIPNNAPNKIQNYHYVSPLVAELCSGISLLAKYNIRLAERVVEAISDNGTRAIAYACIACALANDNQQQALRLLGEALKISSIPPEPRWQPWVYLELNEYLSEHHPPDYLKRVYQGIEEIPPNQFDYSSLSRHYVSHVINKGNVEEALQVAKAMPAIDLLFQAPIKVQALLDVSEAANKVPNTKIAEEAWNLAHEILHRGENVDFLPRLASLAASIKPLLADELFAKAVEYVESSTYHQYNDQILENVAKYQATSNKKAAIDAARKIEDPYSQALALATIVSYGNLPDDDSRQITEEAIKLLEANQEGMKAKAQTLLTLIEASIFDKSTTTQLLENLVEAATRMYPVDRQQTVKFLIEAHNHFMTAGKVLEANQTLAKAQELALSAPRNKSLCLVQLAEPFLLHSHEETTAILYEALRLARLDSYDMVGGVVLKMIPVLHKLGGEYLLKQLHVELEAAVSFSEY